MEICAENRIKSRGAAYRRKMKRKHRDKKFQILRRSGYHFTYRRMGWEFTDGIWQPVGNYLKYPKNSNSQQYWKRHSNKLIRRRKEAFRGNRYRRCFDYSWTLY